MTPGHKPFTPRLILAALLLFYGCDTDSEYTTEYSCRFTFYASLHSASKLLWAVAPGASGVFACISVKERNGVRHLITELNDGTTTEDLALTTAKENLISYELGANNSLIIGNTAFNGVKAYDRQCPHCLDSIGGYSYPLTWTESGQWVRCSRCRRSFALETGALAEGGKSRGLLEYHCSYDGSILTAYN